MGATTWQKTSCRAYRPDDRAVLAAAERAADQAREGAGRDKPARIGHYRTYPFRGRRLVPRHRGFDRLRVHRSGGKPRKALWIDRGQRDWW